MILVMGLMQRQKAVLYTRGAAATSQWMTDADEPPQADTGLGA